MLTLSLHNHQNPFFLSPSLAYTLCTLILTLLATTLIIIRFRHNAPSIPLLVVADYDYTDTDDNDDDGISSDFEHDDQEQEEEQEEEENKKGEYFRVRGSENDAGGLLRRRSIGDFLSLSEIANNKSVVKLWDTIGFGLGFGFDHSSDGSIVSVYDGDYGHHHDPAVVVSTGESASGNLAVNVWDSRLRRRIPAVMAEWGPSLGKTVGVESDGVHKVYVKKDDGRYGFTVGDMRNARSPLLQNVTESHLDLWWPNSFLMKI